MLAGTRGGKDGGRIAIGVFGIIVLLGSILALVQGELKDAFFGLVSGGLMVWVGFTALRHTEEAPASDAFLAAADPTRPLGDAPAAPAQLEPPAESTLPPSRATAEKAVPRAETS